MINQLFKEIYDIGGWYSAGEMFLWSMINVGMFFLSSKQLHM